MAQEATTRVVPFPFAVDAEAPAALATERRYAKRWKFEALFAKGHVGVPTLFFHLYARLKPYQLTSGEALFVLHLMQYKWDEQAPFPAYKTLAKQMGVSDKMTRRHAASLEQKGYLKRDYREGQTNRFDLSPLFHALKEAAESDPEIRKTIKDDSGGLAS